MDILIICIISLIIFKMFINKNNTNVNIKKYDKDDRRTDKDIFLKFAAESNQRVEDLWIHLMAQTNADQTFQEFMDSEKIDYKLYGILIREINDFKNK